MLQREIRRVPQQVRENVIPTSYFESSSSNRARGAILASIRSNVFVPHRQIDFNNNGKITLCVHLTSMRYQSRANPTRKIIEQKNRLLSYKCMTPHQLHPVENAGVLESRARRLFQNPARILKRHIEPGTRALDLGCDPGYFTVELSRLVGDKGKVVAVDVQTGMLEILKQKMQGASAISNIRLHHAKEDQLGLTGKFDFILAFYSLHEMRFFDGIINEIRNLCTMETKVFIAEQKYHVPKRMFHAIIRKMEDNGFVVTEKPKIFFSRAVVMTR